MISLPAFSGNFADKKSKLINQIESKIQQLSKSKKLSPLKEKIEKKISQLKADKGCVNNANDESQLKKCAQGKNKKKIDKSLKALGF